MQSVTTSTIFSSLGMVYRLLFYADLYSCINKGRFNQMNINEIKQGCREKHLLYVEDNDRLRESNQILFEALFQRVTVAKNGAEGLELFQKREIDFIITDLNLPIMNGLEMLKRIVAISPELHTIVYTAYKEYEYLDDLRSLHIDMFLSKPSSREEILNAIWKVRNNAKEVV